MKRIVNIAAGFGLLCCLFTLSQCGLETIAYLSPPVSLGALTSGLYFSFQKTTENDLPTQIDIFEGFEIYYKFYKLDDTTDTDIVERSELVSKGFHRLSRFDEDEKDDPDRPLVEGTTTGKTIFVNLDPPGELNIADRYDTSGSGTDFYVDELRRGVPYDITDTGEGYYPYLKRFLYIPADEHFLETDADVGSGIWSSILGGEKIVMLAYALSYGRADFVDVYSEAEFLGYIDVNFGW